jgi:hypothetical protein
MPGADMNQWFNYGFTEETWLLYCQSQLELRKQAILEEYKLLSERDD